MNTTRCLFSGLMLCAPILVSQPAGALAQSRPEAPVAGPSAAQEAHDGQHDFDWEIGTWRTDLLRLMDPLSGTTTWAEYEGTSVVREVWGGRANLVELDVEGPTGRLELLSLRLYNPRTRQWSLQSANSSIGNMNQPVVGGFRDGRGIFYGQTTFDGRPVYVRFVISPESENAWRFEQAFSVDGGGTWEVNWIAIDTRIEEDGGDAR